MKQYRWSEKKYRAPDFGHGEQPLLSAKELMRTGPAWVRDYEFMEAVMDLLAELVEIEEGENGND